MKWIAPVLYAVLIITTVSVAAMWVRAAQSGETPPARYTLDESFDRCLVAGGTFTYIGVSDAHSYECKIETSKEKP